MCPANKHKSHPTILIRVVFKDIFFIIFDAVAGVEFHDFIAQRHVVVMFVVMLDI